MYLIDTRHISRNNLTILLFKYSHHDFWIKKGKEQFLVGQKSTTKQKSSDEVSRNWAFNILGVLYSPLP